jgi:hypothetical protein
MAEKQLAYRASGNDEFFADDDPLAELARIVGFEPRPAAQAAPAEKRQEPAFDLEDELLREFERYDAPRPAPADDISVPDVGMQSAAAPAAREPIVEPVPRAAELQAPQPPDPAYAPAKPSLGARDLIDELEMSIAPTRQSVPQPPTVPPQSEPVVRAQPQPAPSIRLPLANFNSSMHPEIRREPQAAAADVPVEQNMLIEQAVRPAEPARMDAAALTAEIDELLADVERYPVLSHVERSDVRTEPGFDLFETDVIKPVSVATQPVAAVSPPVAPVEQHTPIAQDFKDSFGDQDFELDLADIEMELSSLDFAEAAKPALAPVAVPQPAPVSKAVPVVTPSVAPAAERTVSAAPAPQAAVSQRRPAPVLDADQPLPFDPSEISEADERIETFEGSHVPNLPVEPEEPIAVASDFDFDLDAEMASLLGKPAKEAPEPIKPAAAAALAGVTVAASWSKNAKDASAAAGKKPADEFDEFERALEEDFRRSFREAATPVDNAARMTLNPAVAEMRRPPRSLRGMATAAAVIAVLGLGAYGIYGWVRHGSPISNISGEPRVITADADPVKVVPENPGGTVVPNQDKAVYDRAAGDSAAAPKQKELVSSNEQPVDVVQKTLIPETVSPDDGSGDQVTPTPVGETEDPRLLPDQGGNNNATADAQVPAVSPRKVRTMIVKPDGSLVARDEPTDNTVTATSPALAPKTSNDNQPAPASQAAQTGNNDAASAESTPIRVVKTTPVPTARPAQQPVRTAAAAATDAAATDVAAARPAVTPAQPKVQPKPQAQPQQVASAAASASAGGYGVQIASLPSEADAQRSLANLKSKFAGVLGGHSLEVRKADIPGKGTYYRVRVVAGSKDDAAAICQRYRAAGGSCLISK